MESSHNPGDTTGQEQKDGWLQHTISFLIIGGLIVGAVYLFFDFNDYKRNNQNRITDSMTAGCIDSINIKGVLKKNGAMIDASVLVPHDIKRAEVRPTLLKAINEINKKHPDIEWIQVWLLAGMKNIYAGNADYKYGQIYLRYGIPSQKQIADRRQWNEYKKEGDSDILIPVLLDKKQFRHAANVVDRYYKHNNRLMAEDLSTGEPGDTIVERSMQAVADELNITPEEVLTCRKQILVYYDLSWDHETIKL